jgi:hypothetical protein
LLRRELRPAPRHKNTLSLSESFAASAWRVASQGRNQKIRLAQKVLRGKTEAETIERALDFVIAEHRRNELANDSNERFARSGVAIKDVFGAPD